MDLSTLERPNLSKLSMLREMMQNKVTHVMERPIEGLRSTSNSIGHSHITKSFEQRHPKLHSTGLVEDRRETSHENGSRSKDGMVKHKRDTERAKG